MEAIIGIVIFIYGLILGSFFNVVGIRVPQRKFLSSKRSQCPQCHHVLSWYELIPVISYMIQNGKCRSCHTFIPVIYPVVEFVTAILFLISYIWFGFTFDLLVAILLISLTIIIFITDFRYMLIPNTVLLVFLLLFVIVRLIEPLEPWWMSILGALVGFGLIAMIIWMSRGGMGAGDMKLFALLGLLLGFPEILLTMFMASLYGLMFTLCLFPWYRMSKQQPIPFGPAIMLAANTIYLFGEDWIHWYISLF
ncbi:A24 family peptidase [Gracilibacillus sp. YIM 98692]|uniref:prepilin peptidase n=1 Tax=Gracilibacillus sp. YIM 98692 TaxID=2663532 RepID=UPI0013D4F214|nr:A24 family peptidase [Gracilibacillus sp. YIM 98692]